MNLLFADVIGLILIEITILDFQSEWLMATI